MKLKLILMYKLHKFQKYGKMLYVSINCSCFIKYLKFIRDSTITALSNVKII